MGCRAVKDFKRLKQVQKVLCTSAEAVLGKQVLIRKQYLCESLKYDRRVFFFCVSQRDKDLPLCSGADEGHALKCLFVGERA